MLIGERWAAREDARQYFENFSKIQKFDPLDARAWYQTSRRDVLACKVYMREGEIRDSGRSERGKSGERGERDERGEI